MTKTHLGLIVILTTISCLFAYEARDRYKYKIPLISSGLDQPVQNPLEEGECPIVAVWQHERGVYSYYPGEGNPPFLRFALWEDGRFVFAADPNKWEHNLMLSRISKEVVSEVKNKIFHTGIFETKETHYNMHQEPNIDYIIVSLGHYKQFLCWAEGGGDFKGNATSQDSSFEQIWHEINNILIDSIPSRADKLRAAFSMPSTSWMLGIYSIPEIKNHLRGKTEFQGKELTRYQILRLIKKIDLHSNIPTPGNDGKILDQAITNAWRSELANLGYQAMDNNNYADACLYSFRMNPTGSQYYFYVYLLVHQNIIWATELPLSKQAITGGFEMEVIERAIKAFREEVTNSRKRK